MNQSYELSGMLAMLRRAINNFARGINSRKACNGDSGIVTANLFRRRVRFFVPAMLAIILLLGGQAAWAACDRNKDFTERIIQMDMGRVYIRENMVVGEVIKSERFPIWTHAADGDRAADCGSGGWFFGRIEKGEPVSGHPNVYTTDVPGVGIRLSRFISGNEASGGSSPAFTTYYPHDLWRTGPNSVFPGSYFQVELIKTAHVTGSGPLSSGTYTTYVASGSSNRSLITSRLSGEGITIITPSCSVDTGSRNIPVEFGKVPASAFRGKGSTAAERNFNIRLNCSAGAGVRNTVYLRMGSPQVPWSRRDGVLQIKSGTAGTVASGVGIQVLDQLRRPVKFSGDGGDDILVGKSKDGAYIIPFIGRYYQTADKITPGRADGTANFDIEYK